MSETGLGVKTRRDVLEEQRKLFEQHRDRVCDTYLAAFSTPAGQRVLLDLEAIVMTAALPPTASEAEFRHLNGQKALFGTIMQRIEYARQQRASAGAQPQPVASPGTSAGRSPRRKPGSPA